MDSDGTHLHYEIHDGQDVEDTISELQKLGNKFRVDPGVTTKRNFAVKTKGGLVVQRTGTHLRIFYSV